MSYKTEHFIGVEKAKTSSFAQFIANLCPCLKKKSNKAYKLDTLSEKEDTFIQNASQMFDLSLSKTNSRTQSTKPSFCQSVAQSSKYETDVEDYFSKKITSQSQIHKYVSVREYQQDRLILVGNNNKILFRIHSKLIKMSANSAEKTKTTLDKVSIKTPKFPNAKMEGWWKKRYVLFDKFDQGLKFDEESYISTPPQSLASYIATRLKFNKMIHVFGGIGAYDVKLINFCDNILLTDVTDDNREIILHNTSIYNCDNIEFSQTDFMDMKGSKSDCVLITPPWGENYSVSEQYDISEMKIDQLFAQALQISSNVVFVLPSNINIEKLADKLNKGLYSASDKFNENCFGSCSFEIEKICFMNRIRFIVVYYGTLATKQIKLTEQLDTIYDIIGNSKHRCRRITKYIRQQYGLPYLLKLSLRASNQFQNSVKTTTSILDKLIQISEKQKIIPETKLKSFLNRNGQLKKTNSKNPNNVDQNQVEEMSEARDSQKTQTYTNSFVSSYEVGGTREHLDGTRRTINIECSGTGSVKWSSKISAKMSVEPEMVKTKIR